MFSDSVNGIVEMFRSIGYINWVTVEEEDIGKQGVTEYAPHLAYEGANLYNSRSRSEAELIMMNGEVVHTWSSDEYGSAKERVAERFDGVTPPYYNGWSHIEMDDNGDLYVIGSHHMLLKLNWDSNVIWKADVAAHHDIALAENGDIYTTGDEVATISHSGRDLQVLHKHILILSRNGEERRRISILDALRKDDELNGRVQAILEKRFPNYEEGFIATRSEQALIKFFMKMFDPGEEYRAEKLAELVIRLYREIVSGQSNEDDAVKIAVLHNSPADILHSNTVEIITADQKDLWKRGDLLVCSRQLDLIAVIDIETETVVWSWGTGDLEAPHHPSMLENGNILIFDNGTRRGYSRIVELDPKTKKIVWTYQGNPPSSFFSATRGGCQKLPNGNVLITETSKGHVFEVTTDGQVVWNFYNPDVSQSEATGEELKRGGIYRLMRIDERVLDDITAR
jgi:hypothetical protein